MVAIEWLMNCLMLQIKFIQKIGLAQIKSQLSASQALFYGNADKDNQGRKPRNEGLEK